MSDYFVDRVVFKYTLVVDTDGTTQDYYVSTHGFRTKPTDTPPNTVVEERVLSAGSIKTSLFSGARATGASLPSYGVTTLVNADGGLDEFVKYAEGGYVTCYFGNDSMSFPDGYTTVYTTKVFAVMADFDKIEVRYQDRLSDLDKAVVTAMLAGTGGLEGYDGISARKPLAFRNPGLMPLILVNKDLQVYMVQANGVDAALLAGIDPFAYVFEGGNLVQRDNAGNYILSTDLLDPAQAPTPGHFRFWTGYGGATPDPLGTYTQAEANSYTKGPIYLRLGTPPTAELRFGHRGFLQNQVTDPVTWWKFSDLCRRAGMDDVHPGNLGAVNGVVNDFDVGNRFVDDDRTYLDLMNDRAKAVIGFFGFDRFGKFYCGNLVGPESGLDTSQFTFTYENSGEFVREAIEGMESPVYQLTVNAGKTRPMTPLSGASEEMTDLVSRDPWYTTFTATSEEVRKAFPGAKAVSIDIDGNDFTGSTDPTNFAGKFFALYGKKRDFVYLTTQQFDATTLALALHDKVTLRVPRFDYGSGTLFRIVDIETNLDNKEIRFGLWGNDSPGLPWVLGGGGYPAGSGDPGGSDGGGGSTPPGGGGGSNNPSSPSYTQTVMAAFGQEMLCVDSPPSLVQEYSMADLAAITRVMASGEPGYVGQVLLIHGDGTVVDSSGRSHPVTGKNGATTSSAQSKFGGSSLLFNGTNHYFEVENSSDFSFKDRFWSVDFWVYPTASPSTSFASFLSVFNLVGNQRSWYLGVNGSRVINTNWSVNGTSESTLAPGSALALNTWTHLAFWGDTTGLINYAINGTAGLVTNYATSTPFISSAKLLIGAYTNGSGVVAGMNMPMYMDEIRICVDRIDYTPSLTPSNFSVPTAAYVE